VQGIPGFAFRQDAQGGLALGDKVPGSIQGLVHGSRLADGSHYLADQMIVPSVAHDSRYPVVIWMLSQKVEYGQGNDPLAKVAGYRLAQHLLIALKVEDVVHDLKACAQKLTICTQGGLLGLRRVAQNRCRLGGCGHEHR